MLETQELVDDRYRLTDLLAKGGMGQVWRATDQILGRTVAIKLLHQGQAQATPRFRAEARAMATLRHPGVADVYDYGETTRPDGSTAAYIVMACVEGRPLSELIAEAGRLDAATTASIVEQTAHALQAVHDAEVVHRDVKPANLVVEPEGHVVLVDFGVAVTAEAPDLTAAHEVVGTALYMAPEQIAKRPLTPATDIYALGAVAYHCLAGRPPFVGDDALAVALRHIDEDPPPLPDDVPAELRHVVATAMAKDPAHRYPNATAMADAVAATAAGTGLPSDPQGTVALAAAPRPPAQTVTSDDRPARRRTRGPLAAAALACLAAVLAILVFADPTGTIRAPWQAPDPPAATTNSTPGSDAGTVPAGGAGGDLQPSPGTSGVPGATPAPGAVVPPAGGSQNGGAGPGGSGQPATAPPAGDNGGGPTSQPTAEPTREPTPEPTVEQTPAVDPEPTGAADDRVEESAQLSPAPVTTP